MSLFTLEADAAELSAALFVPMVSATFYILYNTPKYLRSQLCRAKGLSPNLKAYAILNSLSCSDDTSLSSVHAHIALELPQVMESDTQTCAITSLANKAVKLANQRLFFRSSGKPYQDGSANAEPGIQLSVTLKIASQIA
jgi:hypothetical protein